MSLTSNKIERLRIEYFALDEVARWPRNPKLHADEQLDESLERFGFVAPAIRDEQTKRLVAGHGRLDRLIARRNAGGEPPKRIEVREADGAWLMPVVCGIAFESEDEAEAYLLADNRLSELGGWSRDLPDMLERMKAKPLALKGVGFKPSDIADLKAKLGGGAPPGSPPEIPETRYKEQYGVIVVCANAAEQERVYNKLKAEGLMVRVVVT